jgi:hypothetical protein
MSTNPTELKEKQEMSELERIMDWVEQYGVDTENFARYDKK